MNFGSRGALLLYAIFAPGSFGLTSNGTTDKFTAGACPASCGTGLPMPLRSAMSMSLNAEVEPLAHSDALPFVPLVGLLAVGVAAAVLAYRRFRPPPAQSQGESNETDDGAPLLESDSVV